MMKNIAIFCLLLTAFLITPPTFANSTIISAASFTQVKQLILKDKNQNHLLLALDDDDTLTMVPCPPYSVGTKSTSQCQHIGGPAWFSWQQKLPANSPDRIWKTFPQLLSITNLLFTMSKMPLDDPSIPGVLRAAAHRGAHITIVSARGFDMVNATENQFQQDGILNIIKQNAIRTPDGHISFPGYYLPHSWSKKSPRDIAYIHGILYVAGQNKGVMIKQFLAKTNQTKNIHNIIFVDDTLRLVKDVANAYKNDPNVNVIAVHFIRLAAHKASLTKGKNAKRFQDEATQQWKNLKAAMRNNLLGSNF